MAVVFFLISFPLTRLAAYLERRGLVASRSQTELPYARGAMLPRHRGRPREAARGVARRRAATRRASRSSNFTGLERSLDLGDVDPALLDDELAPALLGERLRELGARAPRRRRRASTTSSSPTGTTAALVATMQVLVPAGGVVRRRLGRATRTRRSCAPSGSPAGRSSTPSARGVRRGARREPRADAVVVLTRLAVTYEALRARRRRARSSPRRGPRGRRLRRRRRRRARRPGRPRPAAHARARASTSARRGSTSTASPARGSACSPGARDLVDAIRARAIELGLEARPMLYPAVVR